MASLKKGSHEKESIQRSTDRRHIARGRQGTGWRGSEEAWRQRAEHLHVAHALSPVDEWKTRTTTPSGRGRPEQTNVQGEFKRRALPWRLTGGGNSCRNSRFQPYQYSAGRFCRCERKTLAESGRDLDNRAAKRVFTRARR